MRQISVWRRVILGTILAVSVSYAHAADVNGRIKGTVTDAAGAVVPNVTVVATNEATGVQLKTVSQANGDHQFQQVTVGTYTVSATATRFKSLSPNGIVINNDN